MAILKLCDAGRTGRAPLPSREARKAAEADRPAMPELHASQRKYLRGLAHRLKPVVLIGQKGVTEALLRSLDQALAAHELVKVKLLDVKEKSRKEGVIAEMVREAGCIRVGTIGHTVILYRRHPEPGKRRITLPRVEPGEKVGT